MRDNDHYQLTLPNSRQMTGISLNQHLNNDLRGFAEGEFRDPIILNNNNDDTVISPTSITSVINNNIITVKTKTVKKKQRSLSLPRSLAILQFVDNSQQKANKRVVANNKNNNTSTKKKRRRDSLTRSLSILFRRLRPSLRRNNKKQKEDDVDSVFTFAGKKSHEQQQFVHQQHSKSHHHHHHHNGNDNNIQSNIIPAAVPISSNNRNNNCSNSSSSSAASSQPKSIIQDYSASCTSGSKTATTTTDNSTMTTAATFISDSSLIDAAGIDLDSTFFSKIRHPTENNGAVLVEEEDSANNNVNSNTPSTCQQQEQQQILKKRESRSSIISRAASRSTITVNSIYNTFTRDDEDAISSLFDMPSNMRNCSASTCIDGKQQKQHQQESYHSQNNSNNNSNINVDEMEHEKQQPITNRGHPNERRLSQSSSTVIHHYSIDYQNINSNENRQQQQQVSPVEDHQDSNNVNENLISMPANTNIKVEDETNQAAIEYIKLTAERLWNEDEGICERERIAEWLGTKFMKGLALVLGDSFRSKVLKYYMNYFNFAGQRIDESFRVICNKMYFKAEAQQIDRILEVFARQYWDCNPFTIMCNHDIIHAVVYSLLLLNTDLHCAHENHKKMTRAKFVRNTMETISDLKEKASNMAAATHNAVTPVFDLDDSNDIPTTQSSASVETNNQQVEKMNRGNGFLPISDGVFSVLSSASIASSRWMLRRSISSKSFNSVPSTSRRSSSTTATKQNKRNSVTSGNHRNDESENDENNVNNDNKFAVKSIDSRESWLGDMENLLKELYTSVKMNQILQNSQHIERIHQQQQSPTDTRSNNNIVESPTTKNRNELKNSYIIRRRRGQSLISPLAGLSGTFDDISLLKQKRRLSHSSTDPNIYALDKDAYEKTTTNNGADIKMCKEGLVMQKHVMEHALKKARYRGWQPSFLIVREGKIDLCRPPSISKEQKRKSLWGSNNSQHKNSHIHDFYNQYEQNTLYNNFKKDEAELIQSIDLKHSVANTLPPPGWHGERHHVFSLQTSNGAVWLFESHTMESTLTWVACCNYWAALLSKESLPGAVCNLDYGWTVTTIQNDDDRGNNNSDDDNDSGKMNSNRKMENNNGAGVSRSLLSSFSQQHDDDDDDDDEDVVISHWIPPAPSMITSQISETEKVFVLERHLISLQYEIKEHRIARESIYKRFAGRNNKPSDTKKSKAINNWEQKMQYLLHEILKYRTYSEVLKCSPAISQSSQ